MTKERTVSQLKTNKKVFPIAIFACIFGVLFMVNVVAATNVVSWGFRGAGSQRSNIGKSTKGATTITITPYYTAIPIQGGDTVGAVKITADPNTPYKNTEIKLEWWTDDSLISVRKATINMYSGQLGWPFNSSTTQNFPLSARRYTANNNHDNKNGHWTFINSNVHNGIYSDFVATFTNWQTN